MRGKKGRDSGIAEQSFDWTVALKALADEKRLMIIRELLNHESSVSDLSKNLGVKIYNISRHLKILENSGIVTKRKKGSSRIYTIANGIKHRFSGDEDVLNLGCCIFRFSSFLKDRGNKSE